jgi:SPP1 gp7 family putative phage head morphogenesis protein
MQSVNDQILDWAIHHAVYLTRLGKSEGRRYAALLDNLVWPDVFDRVNRIPLASRGMSSGVFTTKTLRTALADIRSLVKTRFGESYATLRDRLVEVGKTESAAWIKAFSRIVPVNISYDVPSVATLRQIVVARPFENALLKSWVDGLSTRAYKGAERAITAGMVEGKAVGDIVNDLRRSVVRTTRDQAEALVRTAVNHTSTQTREAVFAQNSDVVAEVQWVSVLDARTTLICMSRDGKRFPIDEGPRPPAHFNCRSTTVPVTKSWQELGIKGIKLLPESTRASMNGQVAKSVTYEEWLRRKSKTTQNEILGPRRAELFRSGQLSIKDMVNASTGRPYTLEQLRKRYGIESNS